MMKYKDDVMEGDHQPDHWNYRQQALASILFDRKIDPIVRRLLVLDNIRPRQSQQQQQGNNHDIAAPPPQSSSSSERGMELERRNQVKQLLQTLRSALNDIVETVNIKKDEINHNNNSSQNVQVGNDNAAAKEYWQSRVLNQLDGIAVPLFSVLRQQQHEPHNSNSDNGRRMHYILQSAAYSCMEEAALSALPLWRCRLNIVTNTTGNHSNKNTDTDNDDDNGNKDMNSLVLPGLVSCAMALSSLDITNCNGDNNQFIGEKDQCNKKSDEKPLDRGEECAVAILRCMQSFLTSSSPQPPPNALDLDSLPYDVLFTTHHLTSPMATEIGDAMGGALVARIVQTCLALLPKGSVSNESNSSSNNNKNNNPTLQLEALKTLQILMTSIPIDTVWRAILPGCFAGLYKCAISKLRYSSSASTHKVASEAIVALSLLLMQSMKEKDTNTSRSTNNELNNKSITETLLAVVQQSKLAVETNDLTDDDVIPQSSVSDKQDLEFENEVNARLPGPLSVLLSLVSTNRSHLVRQRGLFLCRVILVETRSMWTEFTSNTLGKKAFEYCLTTLNDDEKDGYNLSDYSWQILNECKSQLGAIEWKKRLSQNTVPTILELLEMLPILAKSGRDVEVRNYLRIIDGYLLISFRGEKKKKDYDGANHQTERSLGKGKSDIGAALSCAEAAQVIKDAFSGKMKKINRDGINFFCHDILPNNFHLQSYLLRILNR